MSVPLVRKLLRDLRVPLLVVALLLCAFQCLWAKVTQRVGNDLLPMLVMLGRGSNVTPAEIENTIFSGPGKIMRTMMGGESISLFSVRDMATIGYVHPLMLTVFGVWAIGRSAGAIAGEIDRGTMELLLAQPLPRHRVILSHLAVDFLTIPVLCLSLWLGNWAGVYLVDLRDAGTDGPRLDAAMFGPALWWVGGLIFAVGGYTMALSAAGRFRGRVMGLAVLLTLMQFLVHVVGQLWDAVAFLRPFTVYFFYQPQQVILNGNGWIDVGRVWHLERVPAVHGLAVLLAVGAAGYALALVIFSRRDLPAPL
jgi:ABC-2 type transport system permease protein